MKAPNSYILFFPWWAKFNHGWYLGDFFVTLFLEGIKKYMLHLEYQFWWIRRGYLECFWEAFCIGKDSDTEHMLVKKSAIQLAVPGIGVIM